MVGVSLNADIGMVWIAFMSEIISRKVMWLPSTLSGSRSASILRSPSVVSLPSGTKTIVESSVASSKRSQSAL